MFSQEDFKGDNLNRLSCIIMHQMGQHPLVQPSSKSKEFDNRLNEYIQFNDDWESNRANEIINKKSLETFQHGSDESLMFSY